MGILVAAKGFHSRTLPFTIRRKVPVLERRARDHRPQGLTSYGRIYLQMTSTARASTDKKPLSRERVLHAAVDLVDREGLDRLTMRRLAQDLGVEAMSIYYHVSNKEALLDGLVEVVMEEIKEEIEKDPPVDATNSWKKSLRQRILTARQVMLRHKWAPRVIESRSPMPLPIGQHFDGIVAIFQAAGFSNDLTHHAMHALGSKGLGFVQELFAPVSQADLEKHSSALSEIEEALPHIQQMLVGVKHDDPDSTLGWCDDQTEFEFSLDLLLDGLDHLHSSGQR